MNTIQYLIFTLLFHHYFTKDCPQLVNQTARNTRFLFPCDMNSPYCIEVCRECFRPIKGDNNRTCDFRTGNWDGQNLNCTSTDCEDFSPVGQFDSMELVNPLCVSTGKCQVACKNLSIQKNENDEIVCSPFVDDNGNCSLKWKFAYKENKENIECESSSLYGGYVALLVMGYTLIIGMLSVCIIQAEKEKKRKANLKNQTDEADIVTY
ncbi:hypothetical protein MHBO_000992 [Bonamia ostreae]|uniref:Uncharacterized protein n=1 Tax=Bonamia ostreae TaxID=126728 RepID=A0ABV2AHF2_9EUKA